MSVSLTRSLTLSGTLFLAAGLLAGPAHAQPLLSTPGEQMRIDLAQSSVMPDGPGWQITARSLADNGTHPTLSFRRWWYFQIDGLEPAGSTPLSVQITNAGYSDIILPVWSLDGGPFERLPTSAVPSRTGSGPWTHSFDVTVPEGVSQVRLAKYFPYTVLDKDAFLDRIEGHPAVAIQTIGQSHEARAIERLDITNPAVPDTNKERVWIHSLVHPAETTSPFVVEGLVDFVLSDDPYARALRDNVIFNIIPMVNPDGVAAGNYRTSTRTSAAHPHGVDLEREWAYPYDSPEPEIIPLRENIEAFMGTVQEPAPNPIRILLNLHSSHGPGYPFHFVHEPDWEEPGDFGVNQEVYELELEWVDAFRARSPFVDRGTDASSILGGAARPFVESMVFDRWSRFPEWTGPPNHQPPVMAITYEGTYRLGPDGQTWNTPEDYILNGEEMALSIADFLGIEPGETEVEGWLLF